MTVRLDPTSIDFETLHIEAGDRTVGWLAAENLSPDDPAATEHWLRSRFRAAEHEADKRRFLALVKA